MSKVAVSTPDVLDLLNVLLHTAETKGDIPNLNGIFLYSGTGYYRRKDDEDDVGLTQLLCGMSSNSRVAGVTYVPAEGQLDSKGLFVPFKAAKAIIGSYKEFSKEEEHTLQFDVDSTTGQVVVTEYGEVNGVELRFSYDPLMEYPSKVVRRWVEGGGAPMRDDAGDPVVDGDTFIFSRQDRDAILKVEKALKSDAVFRKEHRGSVFQVGVGDYWRGGVVPGDSTKSVDAFDLEAELVLPDDTTTP